jgi:hypothetical protein
MAVIRFRQCVSGWALQLAWIFVQGLASFPSWANANANTIEDVSWVYPERSKPPFIGEAPDSGGFFNALFQRAAVEANLSAQVERVPKARAWRQLDEGSSDFYPGASFSPERSKEVVWINTGLLTREVCLLRPGLKLQGSLRRSAALILGVEPGSSKPELFKQHRFQNFGSRLTIEKAVDVLARRRADVVIVDIEPLTTYMTRGGKEVLTKLGVAVDENCIGPWQPMYLAWSRAAIARSEGASPLPILSHAADQSAQLPRGSKAARFHAALMRIKTSGQMARLAAQYGLPVPQ